MSGHEAFISKKMYFADMIMVLAIEFYTDVRIHAEPIEGSLQQYVEDMQPGWNLGNRSGKYHLRSVIAGGIFYKKLRKG